MELRAQPSIESRIKHVLVYLRKSRGGQELEDDLIKHRKTIEEICIKNNWMYVVYEEIASGSDIANRPEMQKVLRDVKDGMFDAVFVFDIDRLGRGGSGDQEEIFLTLKHSDTLLITANPYKVYDLNDESDETLMDVHGFVAKMEYRQIRKRMVAGKKIGLRMGRWVHGSVPYGYEYNADLKKLDVHEEHSKIVRKMVDMYLNGTSTTDIAWHLNRQRIPSPRGNNWTATTIARIFRSQVYLGHVVGNKSEGNNSKTKTSQSKNFRYLPESEWIVVMNCHEALITEEEHNQMTKMLNSNNKRRYANKINTFTGIVKCGMCGETMHHKDFHGKDGLNKCPCGNKGGATEVIEVAIYESAIQLKDKLNKIKVDEVKQQKEKLLNTQLEELEIELDKIDKAIERIEEAFEAGLYDVNKTRRKIEERQQERWKLEKESRNLRKQLTSVDNQTNKERVTKIDRFIKDIKKDINSEEKNKIYKELISEIVWTKPNYREVDVTINFL